MANAKHYAKIVVEFSLPLVGNHTDDNSVLKSLGDAFEDFSRRIPTTHPRVGDTIYIERQMPQGGKLKSDEWTGGEATATIKWEIIPSSKTTTKMRWINLEYRRPEELELYQKKFPDIKFKVVKGKLKALLPSPHPNEISREVCQWFSSEGSK